MANVPETPSFDAGIYQIETTDPVLGGPNGIANAQAKGLANRTAFLKQQIDQLNSGQFKPSWIASTDYVQGELQKLDAKQSVRAATVANITLSGAQTIDGVTLTVGDRVLVKDQTAAAQNGIYLVAAQSWTRAADADNGTKLSSGARVAVEEGTVNAGKVWYLATVGVIAVGTTALLFTDEHPSATESVSGVAKVATQSDVNAGSSDSVLVTPKKLRFGFSFQTGQSGYIALPSWLGGFIIQWGAAFNNPSATTITEFPLSFPNECFNVVASGLQIGGNLQAYVTLNAHNKNNFSWNAFYANGGSSPALSAVSGQVSVRYIALGR